MTPKTTAESCSCGPERPCDSETPLSDAALCEFDSFMRRVRERLENGRRVYGDSSFERPLTSLVEEIRQEVLDQAGWSFILFVRLCELERMVEAASKKDVIHAGQSSVR